VSNFIKVATNTCNVFTGSGDIKLGTLMNYVHHNMINEVGIKHFRQNCGHLFLDGGSNSGEAGLKCNTSHAT